MGKCVLSKKKAMQTPRAGKAMQTFRQRKASNNEVEICLQLQQNVIVDPYIELPMSWNCFKSVM